MSNRAADERGAVAIIVSLVITILLVIAALVIDFGLLRVDRQVDRSAIDASTLAGLHGLNAGDGVPHPYMGVCNAVRYLKVNDERFAGINEATGWRNGLGAATGNGCASTALRSQTCRATDRSTWARWGWTGTSNGVTVTVDIESGYAVGSGGRPEGGLPASAGDPGSAASQGCDHLAVTLTQSRRPGLGSLATQEDLTTTLQSVGRVKPIPGGAAPAMLLLKRTGCPVLTTGASGGSSFIHVLGASTADGKTQPGTIHADSDGAGCTGGNNGSVFGGLSGSGIVAYAAPVAGAPGTADSTKPGSITTLAALRGWPRSVIEDSLDNVHSSAALNGTGGARTAVAGRSLVTREPVDDRYLAGVRAATSGATSTFLSGAASMPLTGGWVRFPTSVDACKPTQAQVDNLALTPASKLYVDCLGKFLGGANGNTLNAGTVYFRGWVNPGSTLKLPNAHHVYVGNHGGNGDAISLGTNASFEVNNQAGNLDVAGRCSTGQNPSKSVLLVRSGAIKQTAGLLRLCRTTTVMMGGRLDACLPTVPGLPPTVAACLGVNGNLGDGHLVQNGGSVDWTAPDTLDSPFGPSGEITAAAAAAWQDPDGPEDLALWSETSTNSSNSFGLSGGGFFQVRGVFMVPNADPFQIGGGASLNLSGAQFVASSVRLNGNTTSITMSVDPNTAVTLPDQGVVGLVR